MGIDFLGVEMRDLTMKFPFCRILENGLEYSRPHLYQENIRMIFCLFRRDNRGGAANVDRAWSIFTKSSLLYNTKRHNERVESQCKWNTIIPHLKILIFSHSERCDDTNRLFFHRPRINLFCAFTQCPSLFLAFAALLVFFHIFPRILNGRDGSYQ